MECSNLNKICIFIFYYKYINSNPKDMVVILSAIVMDCGVFVSVKQINFLRSVYNIICNKKTQKA